MKKTLHRLLAIYLMAATALLGMTQSVQAAMISSEEVIAQSVLSDRERASAFIDRADVSVRLQQLGVAPADARARVAALSDDEARTLVAGIDDAAAGGIIELIVFLFLVLLITDILGFTKVFPFTRAAQ